MKTLFWWYLISKFSIHNIEILYYNRKYITNDINSLRNYQASCIFVAACTIRSFYPRIDGKRICFFDTWISYPLIGRICATFGELAFVYQLTLITKLYAHKLDCYKIYHMMNIIMNLIVIAQIFCWYGVLFQKNMMHVIEESIWMFTMSLIGFSYLYFSKLVKDVKLKYYFVFGFCLSSIYTMFMLYVDIPMYYNRYLVSNLEPVKTNMSLYNSLIDLTSCKQISQSYNIWKDEIPWMTGYFIGATWVSINLVHFPELLGNIN
jgi:hypothetical protein